jgi:hypothetical protein
VGKEFVFELERSNPLSKPPVDCRGAVPVHPFPEALSVGYFKFIDDAAALHGAAALLYLILTHLATLHFAIAVSRVEDLCRQARILCKAGGSCGLASRFATKGPRGRPRVPQRKILAPLRQITAYAPPDLEPDLS